MQIEQLKKLLLLKRISLMRKTNLAMFVGNFHHPSFLHWTVALRRQHEGSSVACTAHVPLHTWRRNSGPFNIDNPGFIIEQNKNIYFLILI